MAPERAEPPQLPQPPSQPAKLPGHRGTVPPGAGVRMKPRLTVHHCTTCRPPSSLPHQIPNPRVRYHTCPPILDLRGLVTPGMFLAPTLLQGEEAAWRSCLTCMLVEASICRLEGGPGGSREDCNGSCSVKVNGSDMSPPLWQYAGQHKALFRLCRSRGKIAAADSERL